MAVNHDIKSFNNFYKDYKDNKIDSYEMKFKQYQEHYTKALFKENEASNYNDIITKFKNKFNKDFLLTQKEVNDIKYNKIGKNKQIKFFRIM